MIIGMPPKLILMDADGVLWRGGSAVPAAPGFINRARQAGLRCLIVSNNAGPDREAYLARCQRLGIPVDKEDIFSVNHLAGPFVARHYDGAQVLVIGSEMLVTQMRRHVAVSSADELLAEMGIEVLGQYTPITTLADQTNNHITEEELRDFVEFITAELDICPPKKGGRYTRRTLPIGETHLLLQENTNHILLEGGDFIVLEDYHD